MSTTILNFPAEVFATLCEFLPYADLENLWNTQSLRLQKILGHSRGIRAIDFEYTAQARAWPSLPAKTSTLSSLTITSLVIAPSWDATRLYPTYGTLMSLPKSLVRLAFRFPKAEECFRFAKRGDKILPRYEPTNASDNLYVNLAEVLPNLATLEIEGESDLSDAWLGTLPSSLTSLTVARNTNFTDDGLSLLPQSVELLRLPENSTINGDGFANLPGLLHLTLRGKVFGDRAPADFLPLLPKNLTELELRCNTSIEAAHVSHLPKSLTKLNLALNKNIVNFGALPQSLVFLAVSTPVTHTHIGNLPPGLKTLVLMNGRKLASESFAALPRTLTSLAVWHATDIDDQALPLLPGGITNLTLDAPNLTDEAAAYVSSPTIRTLRLLSCPLTDAFVTALVAPHLIRLDLTGADALTDECISHLPRTLRHLNFVSATKISPKCLIDLPPGLIHCSLMSATGFQDTDRSEFPASLRTFFAADRNFIPVPDQPRA